MVNLIRTTSRLWMPRCTEMHGIKLTKRFLSWARWKQINHQPRPQPPLQPFPSKFMDMRRTVFASLCLSLAAAPQSSAFAATVAKVSMNASEKVGTQSAGWACLPSGTLHARDFASDDDLVGWLEAADNGRAGDKPLTDMYSELHVTLQSIKAKLCAKSYGMFGLGDKRSLSGTAEFGFDWTATTKIGTSKSGRVVITVSHDKKSAVPPPDYARDAVTQLAAQHLVP